MQVLCPPGKLKDFVNNVLLDMPSRAFIFPMSVLRVVGMVQRRSDGGRRRWLEDRKMSFARDLAVPLDKRIGQPTKVMITKASDPAFYEHVLPFRWFN